VTLPLVLASSSPYRRQLLQRLTPDFVQASPAIDETVLPGESPAQLAPRLAATKALVLSRIYTNHLIIGSDQVASLDGKILNKPSTLANAEVQLRKQSGRTVQFITSVCLLNSATGEHSGESVLTEVRFRELTPVQIRHYLESERPFDCAGSFKAEGLGIVLFEALRSEDPTALIGLPLIALRRLLSAQDLEFI